MRPVKTQISLGIHPVWSESSLCTQWVGTDTSFLHADSEDSDQTGRKPTLIWVFAGRTLTLSVLSYFNESLLFYLQFLVKNLQLSCRLPKSTLLSARMSSWSALPSVIHNLWSLGKNMVAKWITGKLLPNMVCLNHLRCVHYQYSLCLGDLWNPFCYHKCLKIKYKDISSGYSEFLKQCRNDLVII